MLRRIIKRAYEAVRTIIQQECSQLSTRRFLRKRAFRWVR